MDDAVVEDEDEAQVKEEPEEELDAIGKEVEEVWERIKGQPFPEAKCFQVLIYDSHNHPPSRDAGRRRRAGPHASVHLLLVVSDDDDDHDDGCGGAAALRQILFNRYVLMDKLQRA